VESHRFVVREEKAMPAVPITSREQYIKAIEVLDRVGGTWHGVGREERFLLVSPRQYQALVEAKVVTPEDGKKDSSRDKKSRKTPTFFTIV
jgi:hypothetical protein